MAAVGATAWAYVEYAGRARAPLLALALAAMFFGVAAAVLFAFRSEFTFTSVQGPRHVPHPSRQAGPLPDLHPETRRGFVALLAGASASVAGITLLPLRSLGSSPGATLNATAWRRGVRLVTPSGALLRVADLALASATPVVPDNAPDDDNSVAVLVRLHGSGELRAYSRICTHAGCAVCIFRGRESKLVCPCHHSVFDAAAGGRILSGPASQPLPELPLAINAEGFLVADGDYDRPIGPLRG
ncbi:MAG: ubiquinol-cytochrome c reductase iron-sulfur subunit [Polyangiaceae bacterium]